jgi:hypothetical protein
MKRTFCHFTIACSLAIAASLLSLQPLSRALAEAPAVEEGFESMFDGKTLDGWDGDPDHWRVEDGVIVGQTTDEKPAKYNTFLIWRKAKPGDFEIKAEFRMPLNAFANSGIQIRSWEGPKKWQVSGYQSDMDWENNYTGIIYGENYRGILANRGQEVVIGKDHQPKLVKQFATSEDVAKAIKQREWNEYDIICQGNHIKQFINGTLTCELTDDDTMARADGVIALQIHAGPPMKVEFRNLRIAIKKGGDKQTSTGGAKKKIVFIAGSPSHGYAQHEHNAGCMLLAHCLNENVPQVEAVVSHGWPKDPAMLADAASIVIYSDGGGGHPMLKHMEEMQKLMAKGVGLACIHYAVEVPKGAAGDKMAQWTGGYFEEYWSVNPEWKAHYAALPDHPVARGVKPFDIRDEWYFHMRFVDGRDGITSILTAIPPDEVHRSGNDAHGANPTVFARKGQPETMCWVRQRPDGGRGFGFTGGHWHWNWGNDNFRKVVLNGIVWTAGLDVPAGGVPSKTPDLDELQANQDKPVPKNFNKGEVEKLLAGFKE